MRTHTISAVDQAGRAPTSSYRPGQGRPRRQEMDRLDRQADLTFDAEFALLMAGGLRTDGVLVDLGSGNGAITTRLRHRLPEATVIGADVDHEFLGLVPEPAVLIEGGRVPLAAGSVDDVLVRFVAQHLRPAARRELWAEVYRILRPGGRVHVIDVDDRHSGDASPRQEGLEPVFAKVHRAQAADGGDRAVIGKIAPELTACGFAQAEQVRGSVSSNERPLADFSVHVGPERHVPHVAGGVLTLADLALITSGWRAILAAPDGYVCVYVHLVRASKPGLAQLQGTAVPESASTTEGVPR